MARRADRSVALAALLLTGGCAVGPDYAPPASDVEPGWLEPGPGLVATAAPDGWWEALRGAMDRAPDIRAATARIEQARAARGVARSVFWPQVAAGAAWTDVEQSLESPAGAGSLIRAGFVPRDVDFYSAGLDASWEPDLFGAVRRRAEAATAELGASLAAREGVRLGVLAETASAWFERQGALQRLAIAERNIAAQQRTLELTRRLVGSGLGRRIDLLRAEAQLDATRAGVPLLRAAARAAHYRLRVLAGELPDTAPLDAAPALLPLVPDVLAVGTRADLLRRRPDLQVAERQLAAATAGIGVARADFFPRLVISASYGFEAAEAGDLGSSAARNTAIVPFVSWPLMQGGRLRAALEGADARALEAALRYEQAVLEAIADAETALSAYVEERQSFESLNAAATASREAAVIAGRLYEQGLADFLTVLDADRRSLEAEDRAAQSHTRLLLNLVRVYKALGGGWELPPACADSAENCAAAGLARADEQPGDQQRGVQQAAAHAGPVQPTAGPPVVQR